MWRHSKIIALIHLLPSGARSPTNLETMDVLKRRTDFNDIKPYNDSEVPDVLQRLVKDPKLLDILLRQRLPSLPRFLFGCARPLTSWKLGQAIKGVQTKRQFQTKFVASAIAKMLKSTNTEFHYSGLENLDPDTGYLFVSNHRDIAMDAAFANYALFLNDYGLAQIGFGDNLIQEQFATDLIRINGGFVVERDSSTMKDRVRSARLLSSYIRDRLDDGESIWLAQSEGRAKDGLDRTDTNIFTMFYIAWRREMDFGFAVKKMRIVPLSVSYQYDPCDELKARELLLRQDSGYQKEPGEDLRSIALGINGRKGAVHLHFGEQLRHHYQSPEEVAEWCDQQIIKNYRLHSSNMTCWRLLREQSHSSQEVRDSLASLAHIFGVSEDDFDDPVMLKRLDNARPELRPLLLKMYANPVFSKIEHSI